MASRRVYVGSSFLIYHYLREDEYPEEEEPRDADEHDGVEAGPGRPLAVMLRPLHGEVVRRRRHHGRRPLAHPRTRTRGNRSSAGQDLVGGRARRRMRAEI